MALWKWWKVWSNAVMRMSYWHTFGFSQKPSVCNVPASSFVRAVLSAQRFLIEVAYCAGNSAWPWHLPFLLYFAMALTSISCCC